MKEDLIQIVTTINDTLNDHYFETIKHEFNPYNLILSSTGGYSSIEFMGISIWNDDDDPRNFDDNTNSYTSDLESYLIKEINRITGEVSQMRI